MQEKQFSRLGGDTLITADFRLITASNKDLRQLVANGEFRQDLYYRINILELTLPALRQRPGDIMLLIQHLLHQQDKQITFTPDDHQQLAHSPAVSVSSDETDLLKKQEKQLITSVIEKTDGDRTRASVMLGISPTTLWRKLKQHNISG